MQFNKQCKKNSSPGEIRIQGFKTLPSAGFFSFNGIQSLTGASEPLLCLTATPPGYKLPPG